MSNNNIIKKSAILRFRQAEESDLDYIMKVEHAEENAKFVIPYDLEKHKEMLNSENTKHFIVETVDGNNKIGFLIISGLANPYAEIEFMRIIMDVKGKGYGREALKMMKNWAFEDLKMHRAWLDAKVDNHRAINLYKDEGFVEEGIIRECIKTGDVYESLMILGILAREYFAEKDKNLF